MNQLISKIVIHPITIVTALIMLLTGHIRAFLLFMIIITLHELGHIIVGLLFKWKISRIIVLPLGAITIFDEILNKPLKEEFLVAISGPIFQIVTFIVLHNYFNINFAYYNAYILIFNLLPIYPLDGNKILSVILNKFIPYKNVNNFTVFISLILSYLLIIIFFIKYNLLIIILIILLLVGIFKRKKDLKYIYNKFLFERYIYNIKFKKHRRVNSVDTFFKDYTHVVKEKNNYVTEKEVLTQKFKGE